MKILPEPLAFEWDKGNSDKNLGKHNVSNHEAEQVFKNDPKFVFEDEKHSEEEKRYGLYGLTNEGRELSVIFTIRNDSIRIITARDMSKKERRAYEDQVKTYTKV